MVFLLAATLSLNAPAAPPTALPKGARLGVVELPLVEQGPQALRLEIGTEYAAGVRAERRHTARWRLRRGGVALLSEWRPLGGAFRLSAGLLVHDNRGRALVTPEATALRLPETTLGLNLKRWRERAAARLAAETDGAGSARLLAKLERWPEVLRDTAPARSLALDAEALHFTTTLEFAAISPQLGFGWRGGVREGPGWRYALDVNWVRLRLEGVGVQGGGRWYRGPDRALADAWLAAALEAEHRGRSLWWPSITVGLERRW